MIVCVCNNVSDRDIAREVAAGCPTFGQLQMATGVAAGCGACHDCARSSFAEHRACAQGQQHHHSHSVPVSAVSRRFSSQSA
jgi:bacterioferritin-associated ferredoxin